MGTAYSRREYLKLLGTTVAATGLSGCLSSEVESAASTAAGSGASAGSGSQATGELRGIFIILSTPYTESEEVDYRDLATEVEWLDRAGVHGIVWPQNSSGYPRLSTDEIMRGMEVLAEASRGRDLALVLGAQQDDTRSMAELARFAEGLGPDAMVAMPPKVGGSVNAYREYYGELARITERPVFIQTVPNPTGVAFTTELILELIASHPNLGYVEGGDDNSVFDRVRAVVGQPGVEPGPRSRTVSSCYART